MDPRILLRSKRTWQITPHPFPVDTWMRHMHKKQHDNSLKKGFPGKSAGKGFAFNVGDLGSISGLVRSPGEGNGYQFQYSDLENSMDYIVYGVTKSWTWLSNFHFQKDDSYFFKSLFFNWRIIPLQGCVAFCSTTMWFRHKYICPLPLICPPPQSHPTPLGRQRTPDWASYIIFKWRTKINIYPYIFNKRWGIMIFIICIYYALC